MSRRSMYRVALGGIATLLALAACTDNPTDPHPDPDPDPDPTPEYLGVDAEPNAHNTISVVAIVHARLADSAFVRFWRDGGSPTASPSYPFEGDTVVRVPVLGLDTAGSYRIEVSLWLGDSLAAAVDTVSFSSGVLPDWIPVIGALGSDTTPGLLALSLPDGPVIVDNTGKVVWYRYFPNGTLNSFQAHADGRYTVLGLDDLAPFHVLDELGEEVGGLACLGYETRFHDLLIEEDGGAWLLCDETRQMDLSALGGVDTARVTATVVQHHSPNGSVLFEWNAFDHFDITDLDEGERTGPNVNFTHGNGIARDTDGDLLLSFRSLNEVTKVDAVTGTVLWRFGGIRNEFTIVDDLKGSFERQHGLRPAGPGQIQLLDNGLSAPSRLVRYLLDAGTRTAVLTMDFRDAPTTYTPVGGSAQYLPNGHGLVSFGRAGRVVEVDEAGNRAWELEGVDGTYIFRAQRIASLYAARR